MANPKVKWVVEAKPTGQWRSFQERRWTQAYIGEQWVAYVECEQEYSLRRAKVGNHDPLKICLVAEVNGKRKRVRMTKNAATLDEAKARVSEFFARNPDWHLTGKTKDEQEHAQSGADEEPTGPR